MCVLIVCRMAVDVTSRQQNMLFGVKYPSLQQTIKSLFDFGVMLSFTIDTSKVQFKEFFLYSICLFALKYYIGL